MRPDHLLLDAGEGRRLERFGARVVDRPSPAAAYLARRRPELWAGADLRWERDRSGANRWWPPGAVEGRWPLDCGSFTLELRPTDSGQLGVFPEQAPNWGWLAGRVARARAAGRPYRVLNLFAFTGALTLAAAAAGAEVTHVDAARTAVVWARRNAERSGLTDRPVRWLVDDAAAFVARELRRGRRYDAVALDPPSYGHGAGGRVWQIETALPDLLADCVALGGGEGLDALLLAAHSPDLGPAELRALVRAAWLALPAEGITVGPLDLRSPEGVVLPAGACARVARP